jgi:hypothetical protein
MKDSAAGSESAGFLRKTSGRRALSVTDLRFQLINILRHCAIFLTVLLVGFATLWAAGALYFDLPAAPAIRNAASALWLLGVPIAWFFISPRAVARGIIGLVFFGIVAWWLSISPRQNGDWKPDVALLADAVIDGEKVTIHNVRNFDYRTEIDFTPRYDTHEYNLSQLRGLDLFVTYWGSPLIAHPIVSFDFGEEGRICFSIETRPKRGQAYSAIAGFYRQFELIYVAADERDVIRVRTNFRKGEDVYLYHLNLPLEEIRGRFLEYVRRINDLHARPEWYNALTSNCTTNIRTQHIPTERTPWDWRIFANGKGDELFYERGVLDRSVPFAELKRRAYINTRARAADNAPDFSDRIRKAALGSASDG